MDDWRLRRSESGGLLRQGGHLFGEGPRPPCTCDVEHGQTCSMFGWCLSPEMACAEPDRAPSSVRRLELWFAGLGAAALVAAYLIWGPRPW